jgi:ribosomal protein S18 acetylase RimI-like enzyme
MITAFNIRWNQFMEEVREHSIVSAFHKTMSKYFQCKRIVVPVYKDLVAISQTNKAIDSELYKFYIINDTNVESIAPYYKITSRRLKWEANIRPGNYVYAVLMDGVVIGDIWCATLQAAESDKSHPDLEWLGIKCGNNQAYMYDMYVAPDSRGKDVVYYLLGNALNHLKDNGYEKVYGYYEKDNLPALWTHRIMGYTEIEKRKTYQILFYKKSKTITIT